MEFMPHFIFVHTEVNIKTILHMEGRNYFLFPLKEAKALIVKNKEKVTDSENLSVLYSYFPTSINVC